MSLPVITRHGNYFGGVTRRDDVAGLLLTETAYPEARGIPRHEHECPSFLLVLSGGFVDRSSSGERRLRPGAVMYHPAGDLHAAAVLEPDTHAFNIEVTARWQERAHQAATWQPLSRWGDRAALTRLVVRIFRETRRADAARGLAIDESMLEVAGLIAGAGGAARRVPRPWLAPVIDQLRGADDAPPSIATLAAHVGVNPSTLYRVLRGVLGCAPSEYVRGVRVQRACEALLSTQEPIGRIAHDCGFYDHAHFTRTFARLVGMTPGAYRALLRPVNASRRAR